MLPYSSIGLDSLIFQLENIREEIIYWLSFSKMTILQFSNLTEVQKNDLVLNNGIKIKI